MKRDTHNSKETYEKTCTQGLPEQQRRAKLQNEVTLRITLDTVYLEIANGVVSSAGEVMPEGNPKEEHTLVTPNWAVVFRIFKKIYDSNYSMFDSLSKYLSYSSNSRMFYNMVARKEEVKF